MSYFFYEIFFKYVRMIIGDSMKDRKGFTLIELLVAITIIGIIMIMTLPAIHNLQRENQEKKFDDYEWSVVEAAKVYEDQYEEDLFGRSDTGCAYIDFNSLVQKKLLATTKISGYECKNSNNGIIIRKIKGTSYYEVYLTCSKSGDTKNLTGNTGICKIFVAVSKCTSTCCGTHDCRCDKNGNNCKQCPDTCTSAKCCGYEL